MSLRKLFAALCAVAVLGLQLHSVQGFFEGYPTPSDNIQALASAYDDEFNTATLNPRWQWINPDPTHWSLSSGKLRIVGQPGDMWGNCTGYKNLLLQDAPEGDFSIQTRVTINPTSNFQQGGLLIFQDENNYIKLDVLYAFGAGGKNVEFIQEVNGKLPQILYWPYFTTNLSLPAFLKISRVGNVLTGFYSVDGVSWQLVGSYINTMSSAVKFGLYSISSYTGPDSCSGSTTPIIADFDYFRYEDITVEPVKPGYRLYLPEVQKR